MVEKLIRDGKVAVLYSPEYGAGWSTWTHDGTEEFYLFDKTLVEMAERKAPGDEVERYFKSMGVNDFIGGWGDIEIQWLDQGTNFLIKEYDGFENLVIMSELEYYTA